MSNRRFKKPLELLLGLGLACGAASDSGTRVTLNVYTPRATPISAVESFQIAVLSSSVDCGAIVASNSCLKNWSGFQAKSLVQISGTDGAAKNALLINNTLGPTGGDEPVVVKGIPPGDNYAIVIEAVSTEHQFLGSFCGFQQHITAGSNSLSFVVNLTLLAAPVACDPRL